LDPFAAFAGVPAGLFVLGTPRVLGAWNRRSAADFAALFSMNGNTIGWIHGRPHMAEELTEELNGVLRSGRVVQAAGTSDANF
jgi:hypothetical protein